MDIAFLPQGDAANGPYYHLGWKGLQWITVIGGMDLLLPACFENLSHSKAILTGGSCSGCGRYDSPKPCATSCRHSEEAWKDWKSGRPRNFISTAEVLDFGNIREEITTTLRSDVGLVFPGWKHHLSSKGLAGDNVVHAAKDKSGSCACFYSEAILCRKCRHRWLAQVACARLGT